MAYHHASDSQSRYTEHRRRTYQQHPTSIPTSVVISNIPLPPLAIESIDIHPLLRYSSNPRIVYDINMRPDCAVISPHINANAPLEYDWRYSPAQSPRQISSLTIRIDGIEHPVVIVVRPPSGRSNPWETCIIIWDVLKACHRAWSDAKHGCSRIIQCTHPITSASPDSHSSRLWRTDNQSLHYNTANQSDAMAQLSYLQQSSIWAGLEPSQTEQDVWILRTRPGRRII